MINRFVYGYGSSQSILTAFSFLGFCSGCDMSLLSQVQSISRRIAIKVKEQNRQSRSYFIMAPVVPVRHMFERIGTNIMLAVCSGLSLMLNSLKMPIRRGQTAEQLIPKQTEPIWTARAWAQKWFKATQARLTMKMQGTRVFNLKLPLMDGRLALTNLKRVLSPQNIVTYIVASLLVVPTAQTVQEGNHPDTVDSIPEVRKSAMLSMATIEFEVYLVLSYCLGSFDCSLCFSGVGKQRQRRANERQSSDVRLQRSVSNILTIWGDNSAPTPQRALTKISQELVCFPEMAMRQILVAVSTTYRLPPKQSRLRNSHRVDLTYANTLRKVMSAMTQKTIILCSRLGGQCFWRYLKRRKPMMLPRDLPTKRKEQDVSGTWVYFERQGMMGPQLPERSPKLKKMKQQRRRQVVGLMVDLEGASIYVLNN